MEVSLVRTCEARYVRTMLCFTQNCVLKFVVITISIVMAGLTYTDYSVLKILDSNATVKYGLNVVDPGQFLSRIVASREERQYYMVLISPEFT